MSCRTSEVKSGRENRRGGQGAAREVEDKQMCCPRNQGQRVFQGGGRPTRGTCCWGIQGGLRIHHCDSQRSPVGHQLGTS